VQEQPYDVRRWRMSERMDRVAGELKWWFRSAAPPELIFLVRALYGLIQALAKLDARLPWGQALDERVGDLFPEARALSLGGGAGAGTFSGVARFLKVEVEKASGVRVKLAMPARLAEDIEAAMDETVLRTVRRQAIDLGAIQESARASGFAPQTLFSVKDEERSVRVWLE